MPKIPISAAMNAASNAYDAASLIPPRKKKKGINKIGGYIDNMTPDLPWLSKDLREKIPMIDDVALAVIHKIREIRDMNKKDASVKNAQLPEEIASKLPFADDMVMAVVNKVHELRKDKKQDKPIVTSESSVDPAADLMSNSGSSYKQAYTQGYADTMKKNAWIFSMPMGLSDVAQIPTIPKNINDAVHSGDPNDPHHSRLRSLGLAGLGTAGALFGLGFAGMGMRDLGTKMSLIAKRTMKNRMLNPVEKEMEHKMKVPAYTRFGEAAGKITDVPGLKQTLTGAGYVGGAIAHPFNKLEDLITKGLVHAIGPSGAVGLGNRLRIASQGKIFDNPAVRAASSMAAVPAMVAGDMWLAPYPNPGDAAKDAEYRRGFTEKLAQYRSSGEALNQSLGGGVGGTATELGAYMLPGIGTGMSLYDAGAQVGNMFSPDKTIGQRLGHGAAALGNVGQAALTTVGGGLLSGAVRGTGRLLGKFAPKAAKSFMGKALPVAEAANKYTTISPETMQKAPLNLGHYITGNTGWQKGMQSWGKTPPGWRGGALNMAGRIGASPQTHSIGGLVGGEMMSGTPADQIATETAGQTARNIDPSSMGDMADYMKSYIGTPMEQGMRSWYTNGMRSLR